MRTRSAMLRPQQSKCSKQKQSAPKCSQPDPAKVGDAKLKAIEARLAVLEKAATGRTTGRTSKSGQRRAQILSEDEHGDDSESAVPDESGLSDWQTSVSRLSDAPPAHKRNRRKSSNKQSAPSKRRRLRKRSRISSIPEELQIGPNPIVSDEESSSEEESTSSEELPGAGPPDESKFANPDPLSRPLTMKRPLELTERAANQHARRQLESIELVQDRPPCFVANDGNTPMMVNRNEPYQNRSQYPSHLPGWAWWHNICRVPPTTYEHRKFQPRKDDKVLCVGCARMQPAAAHLDIEWELNPESVRFCAWMGRCCAEKTTNALTKNLALATYFSTACKDRRTAAAAVLYPKVEEV